MMVVDRKPLVRLIGAVRRPARTRGSTDRGVATAAGRAGAPAPKGGKA